MKQINLYSILKITLLSIAILCIAFYVHHNINEISQFKFTLNIFMLVKSFILLAFAQVSLPIIWYFITHSLKCNLSFGNSIRIRLIAEIGKYIPGRLFGYGYLIMQYKEKGINTNRILTSSFYELLLSIFSSFLFFSITLIFTDYNYLSNYKVIFYSLSILGIILIHPKLFQKLLNFVLKLLKKKKLVYNLSYGKVLQYLFYYILVWVVYGIAFYFFINVFNKIAIDNFIMISGIFALSTFSGFLLFLLPAGIGAREGLLIILLGTILGNSPAIIISICSRLWMIFIDLILFFISLLFTLFSRNQHLVE